MWVDLKAPAGRRLGRLSLRTGRDLAGRVLRHFGWGVGDQALSSLTNLLVTLSVARTLGAEQFGAFSLAYVTYGFALTASRALATDPLMVRYGGADRPSWRRAIAGCSGTAVTVGLASGTCVLGVAALTHGTTRDAFLALGLVLPGLMLQDSWRYAFFVARRGGQAFLNDLVWALSLVPAIVLLRVTDHENVFWFVVAWGAAAAVAAGVGALQTRVLPRLSAMRQWMSHNRDIGFRYLAEGASSSAATQARTVGIGLILGLAAVGYVQAAYTLMGPLMIMMFGTGAVIVPELGRLILRSPGKLSKACLLYGAALAAIAVGWGAFLMLTLPLGLGHLLLGDVWEPTYRLVPLITLAFMGGSIQIGAGVGLRALGAAQRGLRAMIRSSVVVVGCGLLGAYLGGPAGTVLGAAVAAWIGALIWWRQLRAAPRDASQLQAPAQQSSPANAAPLADQGGGHNATPS